MLFKKKEKKQEEKLRLCEGISIDKSISDIKENRIFTLILNGIMVYFMSAGAVLGYLSASGTEHSPLIINLVILVTAIYLSCIYYNSKTENIGNIVALILFVILGFACSLHINSGFYSVLNDINTQAKEYFSFTGIRTYAEPIENRYLAVNIAMSFLGVILNLLINMWMLKRMMYLDAMLIGIMACMIPVYVQCEPDLIYVIMIVVGGMLGYVYKRADVVKKSASDGAYEVVDGNEKRFGLRKSVKNKEGKHNELVKDVNEKDNKNIIRKIKDKQLKKYKTTKIVKNIYGIKTFATVGIQLVILAVFVVMVMQIVEPKKDYYDRDSRVSTLKMENQEKVGNFWQSGLFGIFNKYSNTGGISSGKLGGVSSVNLDYQTDFKLKFAPYTYETIYLKQWHYGDYEPYVNKWNGADVHVRKEELKLSKEGRTYGDVLLRVYEQERAALDKKLEQEELTNSKGLESSKENNTDFEKNTIGQEENKDTKDTKKNNTVKLEQKYMTTGKAVIEIEPVEPGYFYFNPYYSPKGIGKEAEYMIKNTYEYYPRLAACETTYDEEIDTSMWLNYPVANAEHLHKFCKDVGLKEGMSLDIMVAKIAKYFQKNMPYTLNPGSLGFREDFVNDFLENKKKGYCVHFATTATLALRYMGVPARYVEGYAVKYENIIQGTMDITKRYDEYFDGYTELGETAVIEVDVTDASAHAWVEVYDEDYGWKPVEVTPAAENEERGERSEFWDNFMRIFREGGENNYDADRQVEQSEDFFSADIIKYIVIVILAIAIIVLIRYLIIKIIYMIRYSRASVNDKLIMDYTKFLKKKRRKNKELRRKMNYKEQLEFMISNRLVSVEENDMDKVLDILDKAGFSKNDIDDDEVVYIRRTLFKR